MKKQILINNLSVARTGFYKYTVRLTLRSGEIYYMKTRKKSIYRTLQDPKFMSDDPDHYEQLLRIAFKVLKANDVCFDEIEII